MLLFISLFWYCTYQLLPRWQKKVILQKNYRILEKKNVWILIILLAWRILTMQRLPIYQPEVEKVSWLSINAEVTKESDITKKF